MKKLTTSIRLLGILLVALVLPTRALAQFTLTWTSSPVSVDFVSSWFAFQESGDSWDYRYFVLGTSQFQVMSGPTSTTPQYTYSFTQAEILAGYLLYSLQLDLTGDGITEFYVLGWYGSASPYRQSFKIFDIVTGAVLFERNDASYDYGSPTIWDVDGNGEWDCTVTRTSYPGGTNYVNQVYATGVVASSSPASPIPMNTELLPGYPNPFNPSATIPLELGHAARVEIEIVNSLGRHVTTVADEFRSAGTHRWIWNGKDTAGITQASGVYFAVAKIDGNALPPRSLVLTR